MLERLLFHLKNWFVHETFAGQFHIENGDIAIPNLKNGQYFRIIGSVFNDGLHKAGCCSLQDETFTGSVWTLAVPFAVTDLAERIESWEHDNAKVNASPYQSESFGGYSYSKATGKNGEPITWKDAFRAELNTWRKV